LPEAAPSASKPNWKLARPIASATAIATASTQWNSRTGRRTVRSALTTRYAVSTPAITTARAGCRAAIATPVADMTSIA
jgi:hypothetical protein